MFEIEGLKPPRQINTYGNDMAPGSSHALASTDRVRMNIVQNTCLPSWPCVKSNCQRVAHSSEGCRRARGTAARKEIFACPHQLWLGTCPVECAGRLSGHHPQGGDERATGAGLSAAHRGLGAFLQRRRRCLSSRPYLFAVKRCSFGSARGAVAP